MQGGQYPTDASVIIVETIIAVNGVRREHTSWSLDREIGSDLPEPIAAGSGLVGCTGQIDWAPTSLDEKGLSTTPWTRAGGWPPRPGDKVTIDIKVHPHVDIAESRVPEWRLFTGRIQNTTGSIADGSLKSDIVDDTTLMAITYRSAPHTHSEPLAADGAWAAYDVSPMVWVSRLLTWCTSEWGMVVRLQEGDMPTWTAIPEITSTPVIDLLRRLSAATGSAFFFDEMGAFTWITRSVLYGGKPVATLTSKDSLLDLQWVDTAANTRRYVTVSGRAPVISNARTPWWEVWRNTASTLEETATTDIAHTAGDVEYLGVETTPWSINVLANGRRVDHSRFGAWVQTDGTSGADAVAPGYTCTIKQLDPHTWVVDQRITSLPTGAKQITLTVPDASGALKINYGPDAGKTLPVIRARQRIAWTDGESTSAARGPGWAPTLDIDAGWMLQTPADRQRLANFIGAQAVNPHPLVTDVPIVPDPRLQLGDIVELSDTDRSGVRLRCLIVGISFDGRPGDITQLLTCRVLSVTDVDVTLAVHDTQWAGATLAQHDKALAKQTLASLDAAPLRTT